MSERTYTADGTAWSVLIVDDDPVDTLRFATALAPLGRPVIAARSGEEALELMRVHPVALVILDIQMPGMDGFETAARIRASEGAEGIPIIFITEGDRDGAEVLEGYQLGGADVLARPVRVDVLLAKTRVFLTLHERTEQLRLATRRANDRAMELERHRATDRDKDRFLAILGHELRSPLAAITTALDLVDRAPTSPVPEPVRRILGRQVRQLGRLVDDLLDIARFSAGKIVLEREPVALAEVVDSALAGSRSRIDEREHRLVVTPPPAPILVEGDLVRLVQVVSNLVVNAAKYTPRGGRIDVSWGLDDGSAFVRVRDTGRGLPPELLQSVFEMFVQEAADPDGAGGLGVGLALVRRLVTLHGGTVRADSPGPGQGCTFEVRLPPLPPGRVGRRSVRFEALVEPGRRLRALVVDDQDDVREMVAELLLSHGHHVVTASDGPSAVETMQREELEVALIDIDLPGMDGYEVARTIRASGGSRVRLVAMTGFAQDVDLRRAEEAGFDLRIVKPATADVILRALHGVSVGSSSNDTKDTIRDLPALLSG